MPLLVKMLRYKGSGAFGLGMCHRSARNSFTAMAFCAYDKGEIQKPQIHQSGILSLDKMKPPSTNRMRSANEPNVLEITIVRPIAPMVRNNPIAIWCIRNNNTKYLIGPRGGKKK